MSVGITKHQLVDVWGLPFDADDSVKVIEDNIAGHSRWSVRYNLVFLVDGVYYRTSYSLGATECQDEGPWEAYDDDDKIFCEVVEPVQKLVTVYEVVKVPE